MFNRLFAGLLWKLLCSHGRELVMRIETMMVRLPEHQLLLLLHGRELEILPTHCYTSAPVEVMRRGFEGSCHLTHFITVCFNKTLDWLGGITDVALLRGF
jgi:hypothetical protein